ncbi:pilus assembly protein CpaF [Boudabousia liubingyangii]|uniref:Pilus assembly protein CpaF n=1 Tax=Boudabousia liubingyangii TaxID=1921764 RepID=A0A1Q5PQA2_9ACTO|nr:pilus assembly protein CpaF [Boudabousia liubingyangii]
MDLSNLETKVRQQVRLEQIDPQYEQGRLAELITEVVRQEEIATASPFTEEDQRSSLINKLINTISGFGPLQQYLDDPEVEEIWCNHPQRIFVARKGVPELTPVLLEEAEVRNLVERMLLASGRRIDISSPFVDATLPGGERLHVVIPPIVNRHWTFNIRKHLVGARKVKELVPLGTLTQGLADFLAAAVKAGLTILVSGATQAGKTTLMRALAGEIPSSERIITCEEVFELGLGNFDLISMQTRPPTLEGRGEVQLRDLVKESLRMRPERLIIGEVRGAESLDMIIALNAGIPGMCTLHANSAREALNKLSVLPLLAGENVTSQFVVPTLAMSIDLVIHINRDNQGHRYISEVIHVPGRSENGVIETATLYSSDGKQAQAGSGGYQLDARFERIGQKASELLARVGQ